MTRDRAPEDGAKHRALRRDRHPGAVADGDRCCDRAVAGGRVADPLDPTAELACDASLPGPDTSERDPEDAGAAGGGRRDDRAVRDPARRTRSFPGGRSRSRALGRPALGRRVDRAGLGHRSCVGHRARRRHPPVRAARHRRPQRAAAEAPRCGADPARRARVHHPGPPVDEESPRPSCARVRAGRGLSGCAAQRQPPPIEASRSRPRCAGCLQPNRCSDSVHGGNVPNDRSERQVRTTGPNDRGVSYVRPAR